VGYKKHTLRLWLHAYAKGVLLVPLVSWIAPGHRGDALFLRPSLWVCQHRLAWLPDIVLADMAYINLATQRKIREQWQVCVLTKLRPDMKLTHRFEKGPAAVCHQGQSLEWLGYEARDQLHWSLFVRAIGQPFILVPVSALATAGLPASKTAGASGLFNMMRNLGGSIGIALLSALLTVRERLHSNRLGEAVSEYNPLTQERLSAVTQKFADAGSDAYTAGHQAISAIDAVVRREATLMAFNDCFYLLGFVLIGATLAAFLSRPVKAAAAAGAH